MTCWEVLTFVRDDARFRCESCGHHGQSAECSRIICTISIRLSFEFTTTSGRDGTVWPMCLHLYAVISCSSGSPNADMQICPRNVSATSSRAARVLVGSWVGAQATHSSTTPH